MKDSSKSIAALSKVAWRAGTSGLVLPVPNKQFFPAEFRSKSRLSYYASLFNSIEINSSFYKIPMPATFEKWSADTPADFQFTVKLWRGITHEKGFRFSLADIDTFMQAATRIGSKKGCILVQLPPSLTDNRSEQLGEILHWMHQSDPRHTWKMAVEFRNPSWYKKSTYDLLARYDATLVLHDMPASTTVTIPEQYIERLPFFYVRFHGPAGDYKGGYSREYLHRYAEKIGAWLSLGKEVYVYFNNTIGDAMENLLNLQQSIPAHIAVKSPVAGIAQVRVL